MRAILFSILILAGASLFGQDEFTSKNKKAIKNFKQAISYYEGKNDAMAMELIVKVINEDPQFLEAHMLMGNIYAERGIFDKAEMALEKAIAINPNFFWNNYYHLAQSEFNQGKYQESYDHFKQFSEGEKVSKHLKAKAEKLLVHAEFAKEAVKNPVPFNPKNMGEAINSPRHEYFPCISVDGNLFIITRRIEQQAVKHIGAEGDDEDFFMSMKREGKWLPAINMGEPVNSGYREGAQNLSPDGKTLFFSGCNRPDGKGLCDLYMVKKIGEKWSTPVNLGYPVNTPMWESQPTMASDGRTLYFASNRGGGAGSIDIWKTILKDDNSWSVPENVTELNTEGKDEAPYFHPDGKHMYFSSDGWPGMGGMDLFVASVGEAMHFSTPKNLGYPINTVGDENTLVVSPQGDEAFFASDREDGFGLLDIYSFELPKEHQADYVSFISGEAFEDQLPSKKVAAKVELLDLSTGNLVVQTFSDAINGKFLASLPWGKDYALNVSAEGYLFYSENFSLKGLSNKAPYQMLVALKKIKTEESMVLKNVFFQTAKFDLLDNSKVELDKLFQFLSLNDKLRIELSGHTDNQGNAIINQELSSNRAKAVYDYLIKKGIDRRRLEYKGYGDTKPIATNDTQEGRAQNRRTEFKILNLE